MVKHDATMLRLAEFKFLTREMRIRVQIAIVAHNVTKIGIQFDHVVCSKYHFVQNEFH